MMKWEKLLCEERRRSTRRLAEEDRTEIQRDYGRVVFSTPVRRMQDKAQVFPLEPIDAVRTRLTHSLEVSSVARGIASSVAKELLKCEELTGVQMASEIETIAATCGLIHDIGNPPFGHAGEAAIQEWFQNQPEDFWRFDDSSDGRYRKDLEQFEGNAQTLRLLATLQILSDRTGLNLTFATLSAALKYTASSASTAKGSASRKKLGFFSSEAWLVEKIRERTGTGLARNPITFLVEASDDIVYCVVDIEDGIKKGVVDWPTVRDALNEAKDKGQITGEQFDGCVTKAEQVIDGAKPFHLSGRSWEEAVSTYFRTLVIGKAQRAIRDAFMRNYEAIMDGKYDKELLYDSSMGGFYRVLREEIGVGHIYCAKGTLRLEVLGRNVIQFLLRTFWEAQREHDKRRPFAHKLYNLLSQNYRTVFESQIPEEEGLPGEYRRALLITDYICGMTDSFALNLRRELQHG